MTFHPQYPTRLLSGSEDELCCIFELTESTEEDALKTVVNVECTVKSAGFWGEDNLNIFCISNTEGLSLWDSKSAERIFNSNDIRPELSRIVGVQIDYIINCYYDFSLHKLCCLTGTHDGNCYCFTIENDGIFLLYNLLNGHKSDIRYAYIHINKNIYTCGEDGILCIWSLNNIPKYNSFGVSGGKSIRKIIRKPY